VGGFDAFLPGPGGGLLPKNHLDKIQAVQRGSRHGPHNGEGAISGKTGVGRGGFKLGHCADVLSVWLYQRWGLLALNLRDTQKSTLDYAF